VRFSWAEGLSAKDIHKEMFAVYVGKCSSLKPFHLGCKHFADDKEVETEVQKQLRDFFAAGFNAW
jgi:hypothetical protein